MAKSTAKIQADRRSREKAWLQRHRFTSWEAVHTALLRGRYVIAFKSSSEEKIMSSSPIPAIVKSEADLLDFPEALRFVINGGRITKKEWCDEKTVVFMENTLKITLQKNAHQPADLILSDGDLLGTDWYVVS